MARFSVLLMPSLILVGCGSKGSSKEAHSVGTYVGGGSVLSGSDPCTYEGGPSVFQADGPSQTPQPGPRFVFAAGKIKKKCGDQITDIAAVIPSGAVIHGPKTIKVGEKSELFQAALVASGRDLQGKPGLDWQLGKDCEGVASFDVVLGAQDTGGADRSRTLIGATKGTCTVVVGITTGSVLYESFNPKTFQAETLVTVE